MSKRKVFVAPKIQDFTIRCAGSIYGHVRVKPSGVAWKAKGAHSEWYMLPIDKFAALATKHGKKQSR